MKTRKRSMKTFLFYDYEHVAKHLEKMARKGWLLSKITKLYWEYRRIEPAELHFAVAYFPEASQWNLYPTDKQAEFWAYCETAGWKLAAEWEQMQIMYSEEKEPVPIETEEKIKLDMIHRVMKKAYLPVNIILICLYVSQMLNWMPKSIEWFTADTYLVFLLALFCFILYHAVKLFGYYRWYRRSVRSVESGGKCAEPKLYRGLSRILMSVTIILLVLEYTLLFDENWGIVLLFVGTAVLLVLGMGGLACLLKKTGLPKMANIVCTLVIGTGVMSLAINGLTAWISDNRDQFFAEEKEIAADDLALVVEDMKEPDDEYTEPVYELERKRSIFMEWTKGRQYVTNPDDAFDKLEYQIYEVKTPRLYDCFLELITGEASLKDSDNWRNISDGQWEADAVYQYQFEPGTDRLYEELYIICHGDRIIRLGIDWETTEEELRIALEKLLHH